MHELTIIDHALLASDSPADQNPAIVYLASLGSANSRATMINALNNVVDILMPGRFPKPKKEDGAQVRQMYRNRYLAVSWAALRAEHTKAIRAKLAEKYAPATVNQALAALRGVLGQAEDLSQISADDARRATKIKAVRGATLPAGREIAMGEILALVQACKADKSPLGARDAAMIGAMYACGLRRAELVALDMSDFDTATGKLTIQNGKGRKARTVYATNGAKTALDVWLITRGNQAGPLFLEVRRGGHIQSDKRLTTQAVYKMLKKRATEAGVKDFSPHDFRRTFISDLLDRGADIATVAKLAGHASVTTTARYDRRDEDTKQKAASLLHFPF